MNENVKIKIIMVEDDPEWLKIMTDFLSGYSDLEVVGTANCKDEALHLVKHIDADVVLLDINLSENKRDGIAVAFEILTLTKLKVIMLTSLNEEELIIDSFAAGAVDYVSKENYLKIPKIIHRIAKEISPMDVLLKDYARLKKEEQLIELTPAERDVFDLIAQGYSMAQIEDKMFKTHNTLRTQVKRILQKLKVKNRAEAVKKVESKGVFGKYEDGNDK